MKDMFKFIGISVRTSNVNNKAEADLTKLWTRFFEDDILHKIPHKVNTDVYAIYTDYESDYKGEYTCFIGCRVKVMESIPSGMIGKEFPAQPHKLFVAKGALPKAVESTWQEIWAQDKYLERSYTYDVEVYGPDSQKGDNSKVDIYIGVK